ncbi:hypothetical protein Pfo_019302 [Paulownia fortunei]|nr:hypothetical protein Pfo_019302 [Paulownia fortunei]
MANGGSSRELFDFIALELAKFSVQEKENWDSQYHIQQTKLQHLPASLLMEQFIG